MARELRRGTLLSLIALTALVLSSLLPAALPAAAASNIQVSRTTAAPRDAVVVTGAGFTPGDNIVVFADFNVQGAVSRIQTAVTANGSGSFSATLTVPAQTSPGLYRVTARDFHGHVAVQKLTVLRVVYLKAGSSAAKVPIVAGHRFYVRGSGFQAGEKVNLSVAFPLYNGNTTTVNKSATADKNGNLGEVLMSVPFDARAGTASLTATGQTSGKKGAADLNVIYKPVIYVNPQTLVPGSSVAVHGFGFVPGATVKVSITIPRTSSSSVTLTSTATADQYGRFSASVSLPSTARVGRYTLTAAGNIAGLKASARITVSIKPTISVPAGAVSPGQTASVKGAGYSAGAQVTISATFSLFGGGSKTVSTTVTTNGNGTFSTAIGVPANAAAGAVTVMAKGPNGQATAKLQVRTLAVVISISNVSVSPGGNATIRGSGFLANVKVDISTTVTLTNGSHQTVTTSAMTNGNGQFTTTLHIPGNARGGTYTVVAKSTASGRTAQARLIVGKLSPSISVAPTSVIPGGNVAVRGSGYLPNTRIDVSLTITLANGSKQTLTASPTSNGQGQFTATLHVPGSAAGGTYDVVAKSVAGGRAATKQLTIAKLAPSVVVTPATAARGTQVTVNGFGFAAGASVTVYLGGQKAGSATANGSGQFSLKVTVPSGLASGSYTVSVSSSSGRKASISLTVNRAVSTHFYFASFYTGTGYHEFLALLNPTATRARVTITYQLTSGTTRAKTVTVNAHSRFTEDVNADLGFHVSAGATVAADVPIVAARYVYHHTDGAVVPGTRSPSTAWYFADGNTGHGYREYVAIENPNSAPARVAMTFLPTHHRAFTVYRTMSPTSRTTFKVNSFVPRDAVGVRVTASAAVVANRTIFIHHGMTSKIGVTGPQRSWYFASGPRRGTNWIGAINPSNSRTYITLHAYGPLGLEVGTAKGWLRAHARVGFKINRIAGRSDASVVLQSSRGLVAEQTTYAGRMHNAATDTFGVASPAKTWAFPVANMLGGQRDVLSLFNPNLSPIPVVVDFMTASGRTVQRTYVVAPLAHQSVEVGSVVPNVQAGIVAASNYPFVALNRGFVNGGLGSMTSEGVSL